MMSVVAFSLSELGRTEQGSDGGSSAASPGAPALTTIFRLFPSFCFGDTIFYMSVLDAAKDPWALQVSGNNLRAMALQFFVYGGLVLVLESKLGRAITAKLTRRGDPPLALTPHDEDVKQERERIRSGASRNDLIRLEGLRKVFGRRVAVNDLYFSVPKGQCFGFLGVNGAVSLLPSHPSLRVVVAAALLIVCHSPARQGKSTTLKMLTGDIRPSSGTAHLNHLDMIQHPEEVRTVMGYCPQADALDELLSAEEVRVLRVVSLCPCGPRRHTANPLPAQQTLHFYARLRGVPEVTARCTIEVAREGGCV